MRKYKKDSLHAKRADERDKKILDWIVEIYYVTDKLPTLEEMSKTFHFSKERARQIMERLVNKGYLFKNAKQGWRKTYILNPDYLKHL